MTLLTAHPFNAFAFDTLTGKAVMPIRRIAGMTCKRFSVDVLHNRAEIVRADWDASLTLGTFTVALIVKGGE